MYKCIKNKKGEKLNESLSVANCLNEHFSSVGKRMANEIENEVDTKTLKNPLDYLPKTVKNSFFFSFQAHSALKLAYLVDSSPTGVMF